MKFGINNPAWLQEASAVGGVKLFSILSLDDNNTISFSSSTYLGGSYNAQQINYKINGGELQKITSGGSVTINNGDVVTFVNVTGQNLVDIGSVLFNTTGRFNAYGDLAGMKRPDRSVVSQGFLKAFNGLKVVSAKDLYIGDSVAPSAFREMFKNCSYLTEAPILPAMTLAQQCYDSMFHGCTSLTKAPVLPATTLAQQCYNSMFYGCTSLTEVPELQAPTLAQQCYGSMFYGCTSLTKAPALPAMTLQSECYGNMFNGCTNLTEAPELPATTLESMCYYGMFRDCAKINKIVCLAEINASNATTMWLAGVSATGVFVKSSQASWWTTGTGGIPNDWDVQVNS